MSADRFVIVNADDFGLTSGINRGIIEAHERGVVTSASLMVRAPAAGEAADYARAHPRFSLGWHVELSEWRCRAGHWELAYAIVDVADAAAVTAECERQLERFRELAGNLPTHIDSHQHVHLREPVRTVLAGFATRLKVPLRACSESVGYRGGFYGQTGEGEPLPEGISPAAFAALLEALPPGWTELGCHPGFSGEDLDSVYRKERDEEVRALCSDEVWKSIERSRVQLRSFADFNP